jgi:hypothetical protein
MTDLGLMNAATLVVWALSLYGALGCAFAAVYVTAFMARLNPTAAKAPVTVRLIAAPAAAALWPWLLVKLLLRADR